MAQPPERNRGPVRLSDDDFQRFREFFYQRTGISFELSKRYFVDKRLIERIEACGLYSFREYYTHLRSAAAGNELERLTNAMTVNETYFMREEYQFKCLVDSVLPELTKQRRTKKPLRIWCVPSSTGEEPYSVAIYLLERWSQINEWDVEIISSDIDTDVLSRAQAGRYSQRSIQAMPSDWLARYFRMIGGEYQISNDLREAVEFTRVNLTEALETRAYRNFDVVFCRNLLIYFDDISRKTAASALYEALAPGGFVFLGHSESMSRISSLFDVRKYPDAIVYRRKQEAE